MNRETFTPEDIRQIEEHGLTPDKVLKQIDLFKRPPLYLHLLRPCTVGDGITVIDPDRVEDLVSTCGEEISKGRSLKFVPASGAASRMFKTLLRYLEAEDPDDKTRRQIRPFIEGIRKFAFFDDLSRALSKEGLRIEALLSEERFKEIIEHLLSERGLDYNHLPKGLLKFHRYEEGSRTAFEEHLVEAVSYAADESGKCRMHFTVSPSHRDRFRSLLEQVRPTYEQRLNASFRVAFSTQKRSTDTLAVDPENRPFRLEDGRLFFRPGGHGALIENLNDLRGDVVYIKNIDNVVPDRLKEETGRWKKILAGYLLYLQSRIFDYVEKLSFPDVSGAVIDETALFVNEQLTMEFPPHFHASLPEEKRRFLLDRLDRPLRVCGMVKNLGEPGGGPFWVRDEGGGGSLQIVESAQVDPHSLDQQNLLSRSTHFNPVDIVCGVRNWKGEPFDLTKYVDPDTYLIARKSKDGKDLKALELPGLWNGGMALWTTIFVEVPLVTFNPVKTVDDLLREAHQPVDSDSNG